jgi:hypothetical protein
MARALEQSHPNVVLSPPKDLHFPFLRATRAFSQKRIRWVMQRRFHSESGGGILHAALPARVVPDPEVPTRGAGGEPLLPPLGDRARPVGREACPEGTSGRRPLSREFIRRKIRGRRQPSVSTNGMAYLRPLKVLVQRPALPEHTSAKPAGIVSYGRSRFIDLWTQSPAPRCCG